MIGISVQSHNIDIFRYDLRRVKTHLAQAARPQFTHVYFDHVWMPVKDQPRFVDEFEKSEVTQRTRDQSTPKKTTGEMHKKGMPVAGGPKSLAMETDTQGASVGEK